MTRSQLRTARRLGTPAYTNAAEATAIARIRREGIGLIRVIAQQRPQDGDNWFGYDLPRYDAASMTRDLVFNSYRHVETIDLDNR